MSAPMVGTFRADIEGYKKLQAFIRLFWLFWLCFILFSAFFNFFFDCAERFFGMSRQDMPEQPPARRPCAHLS
jgi:hypothetical protein